MNLVLRSLLVTATLALSPTLLAAELPNTFHNQYVSSALGFKITVTHSLEQLENGRQKMNFRAESWFASIDEVSYLEWNDEKAQVLPLHYVYKRRGVGRNKDTDIAFEWAEGRIVDNLAGSSKPLDTSKRLQDKLSYQLQLQQDLLDGKTKFAYTIADGGDNLREYAFEVVGEETLDTPLGKVDTVKVKRSRENSDRVTYAWLAKDWDYLLVRMQQEEKGDTYTITLNKANMNGKDIKSFQK